MKRLHVRFAIAAVALCGLTTPARAQNHVVVQAEDFVSTSDVGGSPGFLTMMDDPMATGGGTPGYIKTGRDYTAFPPEVLANYGIDFPTTDPYHLYVRGLAEGADGGNDSLWVANGFGSPAPDFYRTNNWSGPSGGDWVWLNLTQNTTLGPPSAGGGVELLDSALVATTAGPFTPASLSGNQFEVGGREDGFRVDAYVFSTEDSLSADQLDKLIGLPTIVGGEGTIGRPKFGAFKNLTFQPAEDIEGVVQFEFRGVNNDGYQFANRAEYETFAAATPPDISGIMAAPILWQNGNYPAEWEPSVATNGDVEDYSVTITGQIFINETFKDFKDGNDDYALLVIDTNGDGDLSDEFEVIDDEQWTNLATTDNAGSPLGFANFTNLPAGGEWRDFLFVMAEGTAGDSGALYWSGNPGFEVLPPQGVAVDQQGHLVPADAFRVQGIEYVDTADFVADLSGVDVVFDVIVHELEWDKVGLADPSGVLLNNDSQITGIVSFEGSVVRLELTDDPLPGMTVDLVDNTNVDQIIGPADFEFSHGDFALWDTSQFTVNGQITYGAAPQGIVGDYNNNGQVEQGDLDLVLLNWGTNLNAPWVTGNVDQAELDGVLLNWGNVAALGSTAGVPEPSTIALVLVAAGLAFGWLRRR